MSCGEYEYGTEAAAWDGGHIKFWSVRTLRSVCESEGFLFERFVGAGRLPSLWKSMILVFRSAAAGAGA